MSLLNLHIYENRVFEPEQIAHLLANYEISRFQKKSYAIWTDEHIIFSLVFLINHFVEL